MAKNNRKKTIEQVPLWVWPVTLVLLIGLFFWRVLLTDQIPMANDGSLAQFAQVKRLLPGNFIDGWMSNWLLGSEYNVTATPTYFLLAWVSPETFARWIYVLNPMAAAVLAFYWLRRMDLSGFPAFFGSLAMTFSGSYLTYILPGHIGKFDMTTATMFALLFTTRAVQTLRWSDFALAGFGLGMALQGAMDIGILMALLLAFWFCFSVARRWGQSVDAQRRMWVLGFIVLLLSSFFTALPSMQNLMAAGMLSPNSPKQSEEEQWNWATQWSYPPSEVADLFMPGYHGWKSNDPSAPYWGALGRNPQFDRFASPAEMIKGLKINDQNQASQALQFWTFRLNSDFQGTVTLLAILLALAAIAIPREEDDEVGARWQETHGHAVVFWVTVAVVALVISFGRHFPAPFRVVHLLPGISSMRNPNKFLAVVSPALAVLAAIGMERLWQQLLRGPAEKRGGQS